jgi:sugar (pentulose or hexulose) kinase
MTSRYLLGVDSGTSVVKSVVFDMDGREIAVAHRDMPIVSPFPGASEVDMYGAWMAAVDTIREVVATVGAESIAAIGLCGTACGVWAIDEQGQPVRTAILWNDGRAANVISEWQANGFFSEIFAVSANAPFPGYPLSSLSWLLNQEPQVLQRARWLLFHKDWIRFNLTGDIHTDVSDVSYFPGDARERGYSYALLERAGLHKLRDRLPPVAQSHDIVGEVNDAAATRTGLNAGTPVVAGAVDVVASALGGGAHRTGQACSILGTSFLNSLVVARPTFVPADSGVQACMPEGQWLRSLVNTTGTLGIDWMIKHLAGEERARAGNSEARVFELIEQVVGSVPAGSDGLVFLPYLNTSGIISPFTEPNARAEFFGLSIEHTRAHLMRAVYEGIALSMRDCYDAMNQPVHEVALVGGGARSAFWAQMFADATGRRIVVSEGREFGARGAAVLAGVGTGLFASLEDAMTQTVHASRTYEPRAEFTRVYSGIYELYQQRYHAGREGWSLRRRVMDQLS